MLGRLLQAVAPQPEDVALCVGCGAGYATAVLSRLCGAVFAIECVADVAKRTAVLLSDLGIDNAFIVEGVLEAGWVREAPYNVILFDGAVAEVPQEILAQLTDGGRLVAIICPESGIGTATILEKRQGLVSRRTLFGANIPILPGFELKAGFVF